MKKILIIGSGVMGSAFTIPCADNGNDVILVGTHLENNIVDKHNKKNKFHKILDLTLPKNVKILKVHRLTEMLKSKPDLIVVAVNSKGIKWAAKEIAKSHNGKTPILILTKGLNMLNNRISTMSDNFRIAMKNSFKFKNLSITSVAGPCLAKDLAKKKKTCVVFANLKINEAKKIKKLIETVYYNIECSKFQHAVEYCAAIKNFYAMIVGSAKDLNTASILFHKSVLEMAKFVREWRGSKETVYGLAGMADLHVTSAGGRNSKMGKYLGEGYVYTKAKSKYMSKETIEGAELSFEIGSKILNQSYKKKFPLMHNIVHSIYYNKKLKIKW